MYSMLLLQAGGGGGFSLYLADIEVGLIAAAPAGV